MKKTQRLDAILKKRGWVTEEQIQHGLRRQRRAGRRWGSTLVELGIITEAQLVEALTEQFGTPAWNPLQVTPDPAAVKLLAAAWARKKGVAPLSYDSKHKCLTVAMADPNNVVLADEVRFQANVQKLVIHIAPEVTLARLWDQFYGPAMDQRGSTSGRLELQFGFSVGEFSTISVAPPDPARGSIRVLLWLSQPFVGKLLRSLLEFERCEVGQWDGVNSPQGTWDYLIYDEDSALAHPDSLSRIKREMPRLQMITRPAWTTSLLRSPLSYERLRDGYLHMAEMARRWNAPADPDSNRTASRYALAMARLLPLTPFEVDTLLVACELIPVIYAKAQTTPEREALARGLGSPFPLVELIRACAMRFDQQGVSPGQSTPESPFAARVYAVVDAFMRENAKRQIVTIQDAGILSESLHAEAGTLYDAMAVEALLRVVREEILEGYLPPGPAEVLLVADRPIDWTHLALSLENEGWRVVVAGGAAEARTLTLRRRPDAVVWAASGAIEWAHWQAHTAPGITNFLILEEFDSAVARTALEHGYEDVWVGNWDTGVAVAKLRRVVQKRAHEPIRVDSVTGTLDQLNFIDMVQILSAGSRSVKIELRRAHTSGRVILWHGQIKFAETTDKKGVAAIYEILTWHDGTFAFSSVETMPEANCHLPNEAILLEGCRLMDERSRDQKNGSIETVQEYQDS